MTGLLRSRPRTSLFLQFPDCTFRIEDFNFGRGVHSRLHVRLLPHRENLRPNPEADVFISSKIPFTSSIDLSFLRLFSMVSRLFLASQSRESRRTRGRKISLVDIWGHEIESWNRLIRRRDSIARSFLGLFPSWREVERGKGEAEGDGDSWKHSPLPRNVDSFIFALSLCDAFTLRRRYICVCCMDFHPGAGSQGRQLRRRFVK